MTTVSYVGEAHQASNTARSKQARRASSVGLIIREKGAPQSRDSIAEVDSFLTPTELFYLRSISRLRRWHPYLCYARTRGQKPFSLSYDELRHASETRDRHGMRHAANASASFLVLPWLKRAQSWMLGAVGNAEVEQLRRREKRVNSAKWSLDDCGAPFPDDQPTDERAPSLFDLARVGWLGAPRRRS